jgi:hypothetical protein
VAQVQPEGWCLALAHIFLCTDRRILDFAVLMTNRKCPWTWCINF